MITSVSLESELYKKAMVKAANEGVFNFSEIIRHLLTQYTSIDEAKLRTGEQE